MKSLAKYGLLAAMCVVLSLPGCGGKTGKDGKDGADGKGGGAKMDQSSPEKVAESFKTAAKEKDWKTLFACSTDEVHKMMLILGRMSTAEEIAFDDASKKKSLDALMKKHGIDPAQRTGREEDRTAGIKDKPAFFGDIQDWLKENRPKPKDGKPRRSMIEAIANSEFSNFKTKGQTATAEVSMGTRKDTIDFKKIDGKWYVHIDTGASKFPKK